MRHLPKYCQVGPGGDLRILLPELLRHFGLADTDANREAITIELVRVLHRECQGRGIEVGVCEHGTVLIMDAHHYLESRGG